jgi:hypothetical protein
MRFLLTAAATMLALSPALAADPVGCEQFKWPVAKERALLTTPDLPNMNSGVDAPTLPPLAATLALKPAADARLPKSPQRAQKPDTFAGYLRLGQIPAGTYAISVSDYAWIDVLQDGNYLKPTDSSGVSGCNGIRKTLKFDLAAGLTTVQVSGVVTKTIKLAVTPSSD